MYPFDPSSNNAAAYSFGDALQQTMQRLNFYRNNSFNGANDPTSTRTPTGDFGASSNPSTDALLRLFKSAPEARQSPVFSNDFMQRHPQLGGALNNALVGAALVPSGAPVEGAGEGVSRALQGALGIAPFMQHFQDAQLMRPIEHASVLAKLFGTVADTDLAKAHAAYYAARPGERLEEAQLKAFAAQQKLGSPIHDADGNLLGFMRNDGFVSSDQLGIPSGAARPHPGSPHTVETGEGVYQFNPDSGRYDIRVGPPKPRSGNNGELNPAQIARMRNSAEQQKAAALRQAENDVRRHYGLDKPDPMNPQGEWPQEAIDEISSRKEQIQNDYLEKLSNVPDASSGSERISVIGPNGKTGSIPRSQLKQAKKQGYRVQ
jgi:hypothetical protein